MSAFVVEGFLGSDSPALFDLNIAAHSDFDRAQQDPHDRCFDDHNVKAIIDTGSRQTFIIPGLFADRHFGQQPLACDMVDASGKRVQCRGQKMSISFSDGRASKKIDVPVYEMQFSPTYPAGFMLIGRSILDHVVFCYDGPNRKVTLTFADNNRVKLRCV
jgi:hypothetical protein